MGYSVVAVDDDGVKTARHCNFSIQKGHVMRHSIHLNVVIEKSRDLPAKLQIGYGIISNLILIKRI